MVLNYLTFIAVALLIGLLSSLLAQKMKVPRLLLLVISGMLFGLIIRSENLNLGLPDLFISGLSTFALILIVFESTARIRFRQLDVASWTAIKLTSATVIFNIVFFVPAIMLVLFGGQTESLFLSLMFAAIMSGTSPDVILSVLGKSKKKIIDTLKLESLFNTPVTVILPLLVVSLSEGFRQGVLSEVGASFIIQITSGIGAGVVVGLIAFKAMRKAYSEAFSPIAVITVAIITYILAENINGSGVLAVTTLGLFFGNLKIEHKVSLLEFESLFSDLLRIIIFVLFGFLVVLPSRWLFFIQTILLFIAYTLIRLLGTTLSSRQSTWKESVFIALIGAKGIPVVVVTFTLIALNIAGFNVLVPYILAFVLLSMIVSTVAARFSKFFLGVEIEEGKQAMPVPKERAESQKKSKAKKKRK
ncbi:cation:proton antiporter [Candidatus Woesearchaeota archaeon]|nr:cation:proton antiporter [Candidatus Woesearchaeota archaeon]